MAVFIRDPETGQMGVMLQNVSMGAAAWKDGTILVQVLDIDTDIKITIPFDPEGFEEVVKRFQKVLGRRIIEADLSDLRRETERGDHPPGA